MPVNMCHKVNLVLENPAQFSDDVRLCLIKMLAALNVYYLNFFVSLVKRSSLTSSVPEDNFSSGQVV